MANPSAESRIAEGLAALEPGRLPFDVFNQIARLTVTPVVEVVPFYSIDEATSVLLFQRPDDDPHWPNQHYVPGAVVNAQDTPGSFDDALNRILRDKLGSFETTKPVFAGGTLCKVSRGLEVALIHWVELATRPSESLLFPVNELPSPMIEGHLGFIATAVEDYTKRTPQT